MVVDFSNVYQSVFTGKLSGRADCAEMNPEGLLATEFRVREGQRFTPRYLRGFFGDQILEIFSEDLFEGGLLRDFESAQAVHRMITNHRLGAES